MAIFPPEFLFYQYYLFVFMETKPSRFSRSHALQSRAAKDTQEVVNEAIMTP